MSERVLIAIDGRNFHVGWKTNGVGRIQFRLLTRWILSQINGLDGVLQHTDDTPHGVDAICVGSYYYTVADDNDIRLEKFLSMLDAQPGYFVKKYQRDFKDRTVNTAIVADVVRRAATRTFDTLVLISGDSDLIPAAHTVRELGCRVFVATWGTEGLSRNLARCSYAHIDLLKGKSFFRIAGTDENPDDDALDDLVFEDLCRAEAFFADKDGGFVGYEYFVNKWKSDNLVSVDRELCIKRLVSSGDVEIYTVNGTTALRTIVFEGDTSLEGELEGGPL